MMKHFIFLSALFLGAQAHAATYTINYGESALTFGGTHAGAPFSGKFEEWSAEVDFDPNDLAGSSITATFNPKSAKTGNPLYDGTLPQADWFDVANHETATFKSTSFNLNDDGTYKVEGTLSIRGIEKTKFFTFTLSDLASNPINVSGTFQVDRIAYDIGKKSDPKAEWVSQYIDINLELKATK